MEEKKEVKEKEIEKKEEISSLKKIAEGAEIVFLGMIIGKIIGYFYVMFIARLGTEQYGLLNLGFSIISFSIFFSLLGLDSGILRYVSYYQAKKDPSRIKGTIVSSLKICLPLSLFFALIMFLFSSQISINIFHNVKLIPILKIFAFMIPFTVLGTLFLSSFRAFKKAEYQVGLKEIVEKIIRLIAAFLLVSFGFGIIGASYSYLISAIVVFLFAVFILEKKVFPIFTTKLKSKYHSKELLWYSLPLMLSAVMIVIIGWTDTLMLGYFKTVSDVGIYNAAHATAALIFIIPTAIIFLFLPIVTGFYSQKKYEQIKVIYKRVSRWIFFINFPIFLVMAFFSRQIITIIFGQDYVSAAPALTILIFGYLLYSLNYTSNNVLSMAKKTKTIFLITLIFTGSNVLLNYILIPIYGVNGAAIATSTSFVIAALLYVFFNFKLIKTYPISKSFLKSFLAGSLAIISVYYLTKFIFEQISLLAFIILFFFFLLLYFGLLFLLKAFKEEDKEIFKLLIHRLIRKKN